MSYSKIATEADVRQFLTEKGWTIDVVYGQRHGGSWSVGARTAELPNVPRRVTVLTDRGRWEICGPYTDEVRGVVLHTAGDARLVRNSRGLLRLQRRDTNDFGEETWSDSTERDLLFALVVGYGVRDSYFPESLSISRCWGPPTPGASICLLGPPTRPLRQEWGYEIYVLPHRYPAGFRWSEGATRVFRVQDNALLGREIREEACHLDEKIGHEVVEQAVLEVLWARLQVPNSWGPTRKEPSLEHGSGDGEWRQTPKDSV